MNREGSSRDVDQEDDADLRARFARMRIEEARRMPSYRSTFERSRTARADSAERRRPGHLDWLSPIGSRWLAPVGIALAAVMLWFFVGVSDESPQRRVAPVDTVLWEPGEWSLPSDALLDLSSLPGSNLMGDLELISTPLGRVREGARHSDEMTAKRRRIG